MRTYVSTLFSSGKDFETWIKSIKDKTPDWDKKAVALDISGDKLRLLSTDGTVLASVDYCKTDNKTITVDNATGVITAVGLKEKNSGKIFSVWIGTKAQYDALTTIDEATWYCITDDDTLTKISERIQAVENRVTALETDVSTAKTDITNLKERATNIESDVAETKETANSNSTRISSALSKVNAIENGSTTVPKASNAAKVNNLEIKKDTNGVLKIGDIIIPQKKLIWSGSNIFVSSGSGEKELTLNDLNNEGDIFEVHLKKEYGALKNPLRFRAGGGGCFVLGFLGIGAPENASDIILLNIASNTTSHKLFFTIHAGGSTDKFYIEKIYKCIE